MGGILEVIKDDSLSKYQEEIIASTSKQVEMGVEVAFVLDKLTGDLGLSSPQHRNLEAILDSCVPDAHVTRKSNSLLPFTPIRNSSNSSNDLIEGKGVAYNSVPIKDNSIPVDSVRMTVEAGTVGPPHESNYISKDSPSCPNVILSHSHSFFFGRESYILFPHGQGCFLSRGLGIDGIK
jgi:hypothetical protein